MTPIKGSSEIPDTEVKDVEYDEFKQSDDNIIEMKAAENKANEPKPVVPEGQMLIADMTREQLINAVFNLGQAHDAQAKKIRDYEGWAADMKVIWNDASKVKIRLRQLKGK